MTSRTALDLWLRFWGAMRDYHRYEVRGLEHLDRPEAALIVGYHGRSLAFDLAMLSVTLHEQLGYLPHGIVHAALFELPVLRTFFAGIEAVAGDGEDLEVAVARGEHIIVTPGGTREGCRGLEQRYKVDWGDRLGYLRLALRHRLPIVPVAADGVDDAVIGFNDGHALGRRLGMPLGMPLWLGLGITGPWPFALPFPVKIRQIIGAPIDLTAGGPVDADDREALLELHAGVAGTVQALLDEVRATR